MIRLPSWAEVLRGPWALRLRSGGTGVWLMRGEAESVPSLECRFLDGRAARTATGALQELGQAFQLDVPLGGFGDLPDAVEGPAEIALLVLDADRLLMDETDALRHFFVQDLPHQRLCFPPHAQFGFVLSRKKNCAGLHV